jgi:hypothetical protein
MNTSAKFEILTAVVLVSTKICHTPQESIHLHFNLIIMTLMTAVTLKKLKFQPC